VAACGTSGTSKQPAGTSEQPAGTSKQPAGTSEQPAGTSTRLEGFWQDGTLTLAAPGEVPAWTIQPGSGGVVLVMYRSDGGSSHGSADNEELVVQLSSAELAAGSAVALESPGRVVRYQRGGRKLTYASTTVNGTLTVKREADRVRGQVSLTASAPTVNETGGSDDLMRRFSFELDRK
jgi:hypothetical protein